MIASSYFPISDIGNILVLVDIMLYWISSYNNNFSVYLCYWMLNLTNVKPLREHCSNKEIEHDELLEKNLNFLPTYLISILTDSHQSKTYTTKKA